jgi:putative ABC transport system permease protein
MSYALTILWHERRPFLPAVVAVAFSALLVALQCGLLLGLFAFASAPVDHTRADVWVGGRGASSVGRGYPIPARYLARLAAGPGALRGLRPGVHLLEQARRRGRAGDGDRRPPR